MSRADELPTTGMRSFDEALRFIREFDVGTISHLVTEEAVDIREITKSVPVDVLRAVVVLTDEEVYPNVKADVNPDSLPYVEEVRKLALEKFGFIIEDENKRQQLALFAFAPYRKRLSELRSARKSVREVVSESSWSVDGTEILPCLRIGLFGQKDELLLDATLDWDDVLHFCSRLLEDLSLDIANANKFGDELKSAMNIREKFGDRPEHSLEEIKKNLDEISTKLAEIGY